MRFANQSGLLELIRRPSVNGQGLTFTTLVSLSARSNNLSLACASVFCACFTFLSSFSPITVSVE